MEDYELSKDFYKIGEVAELLEVPPTTLRFWEQEFPACRPRRSASNRRYYSRENIRQLKIVKFLLKDKGMKIEAARLQMKVNPEVISRQVEVIEQLTSVRNDLNLLLKSLEKRR
ncbi:MAG: MerR family transcriptional regulator [Bacteroides sp.]|nr:MerR family transcriptional regulator [Bacteroides sp.]